MNYHKLPTADDSTEKPKKSFSERFSLMYANSQNAMKTIKMILPYYWAPELSLRIRVVICVILLFITKGITVTVPLFYREVINSLPGSEVYKWVILYSVFRICASSLKDIRDSVFIHVNNYATREVAVDTFSHVHHLSLAFHLSRNTGALLRTMDRGKNAITSLTSVLFFMILPTFLEVILTIIVLLATFGWEYSLITFLAILGYMIFTFVVTEWRTKIRREMNDRDNDSSNKALDSLINFETVKYFTAEDTEVRQYNDTLTSFFGVNIKTQYSLSFLNIGQQLCIALGLFVSMMVAAAEIRSGKLDIGSLVAINAFLIQLYAPLNLLGSSYRMVTNSFTDMEKIFELLTEDSTVQDPAFPKKIKNPQGNIEFREVSFFYPKRGEKSSDRAVLDNVSFVIPSGKTLAIVGHSGSGKTTTARLLCRFYDPSSGSILVDGIDIKDITQKNLRQNIGVVPQDTVLFNDTLSYNIGYGKVGKATQTEIEAAARGANIEEFILNCPDQYDTKVGERGLRLSGGEKQRIAIARTLLKDPKILILDEATSALDTKTESEIQVSLNNVSRGRTTLIIAHRLSTIVNADEIIVLKAGKIVERGNHQQLLNLGGEYAAMWKSQAKEAEKMMLLDSNKEEALLDL